MFNYVGRLFSTDGFMPHGMCYLWNPAMVRLQVISDLLIGLAYLVISLTLAYFVRRARRDIPFSWMFLAFGAFILACGGTHFMEVWTLWTPVYWLSGAVKVLTAGASLLVALMLPPLLPKSLALLRQANLSEQRRLELEQANAMLAQKMSEQEAGQEEIRRLGLQREQLLSTQTAHISELHHSLALMENTVQHSHDAIWMLDLNATITAWNLAAEHLYGYRAEEVIGHPVSILAPPERKSESANLMAQLAQGETVASRETERVNKSGETIYVFLTILPIHNERGEILGASVLTSDITARRRADDMFRLAVQASPSAMTMINAEGKIVFVNTQTEKLFGYSQGELIGRQIDTLVPSRYRDHHAANRGEFMREPRARAMGAGRNLSGLRKDGSEFPVEIGLNPIQTDRGMLVLSAIVDITERKRAEEEIQHLNESLERVVAERTKELIAVNSELESFSYSVAHDLRAPVRQIAGFSRILFEECGASLDDQAKKYLRRVQDGASHMGNLVDDLLNLAHVSRQVVSKRPTRLNGLISNVLAQLEPECAGLRIEWRIEELWVAQCDAALVQQAFANLLSNAVKFTRGRDPAVIQVGTLTRDGERIVFVRDNGAGFDMAYAGKLFGVFQRLHTPQEFEGTGIGLANVEKIIRKHGGRIWAEAEVDQGATFFFTLPDGAG